MGILSAESSQLLVDIAIATLTTEMSADKGMSSVRTGTAFRAFFEVVAIIVFSIGKIFRNYGKIKLQNIPPRTHSKENNYANFTALLSPQ